jgi:hypothetical protein
MTYSLSPGFKNELVKHDDDSVKAIYLSNGKVRFVTFTFWHILNCHIDLNAFTQRFSACGVAINYEQPTYIFAICVIYVA